MQILASGSRFLAIERLTTVAGDGADTIVTKVGTTNTQDNDVVNGGRRATSAATAWRISPSW